MVDLKILREESLVEGVASDHVLTSADLNKRIIDMRSIHKRVQALQEAISREFNTVCCVSVLSFGPDGGGEVSVAVDAEHVEEVRSKHPGVSVHALFVEASQSHGGDRQVA